MTDNELLPCPLCEGKAIHAEDADGIAAIGCPSCGLWIEHRIDVQEIKKALEERWNRRPL